jgi:hypothetical protein
MVMSEATKAFALVAYLLLSGTSCLRAANCEDLIERHMVGEALLTANLVAMAEKANISSQRINAMLRNIAENSAIQEFWITDSTGHAYLTNTGIDFTFSADPAKQPQASAFWPLIDGSKEVVVQKAKRREIDSKIFKYVGVAGVDKPRIVQVGIDAGSMCK